MLSFGAVTRVWVATQATDLRKSYDGLVALVEGSFGRDAMSGHRYVFLNRRATQVRILFWDRDGFCILMKRLEAGTFRRCTGSEGEPLIEVDVGELAMVLEGIDAKVVRRRKRYKHHAKKPATDARKSLTS